MEIAFVNQKVTLGFNAYAYLLVDLDPAGNGVLPFDNAVRIRGFTKDDCINNLLMKLIAPVLVCLLRTQVDFEFLLSAEAAPFIQVDADPVSIEIDLHPVINADVDLHVLVQNGLNVAVAAEVEADLGKFCVTSDALKPLCEMFNLDSHKLKGGVRMFANPNGFGLRYDLEGRLKVVDDFKFLIFDFPDVNVDIDVMISLELTASNKIKFCVQEGDSAVHCFDKCERTSDCESHQYCHPITKSCIKKQPNGYVICTGDDQCKSGYCLDTGMCAECPTMDSSEGCLSTQYCDGFGNVCKAKKGDGGLCLSNNVW